MKRRFSIPQFVVYLAAFVVAGGAFMDTRPSTVAILATFVVLGALTVVYGLIEQSEDRNPLDAESRETRKPRE